MIGEECVLEFFKDLSHEAKAKANNSTRNAMAKAKVKIVLEDPRGRGLVLEDSNTASK